METPAIWLLLYEQYWWGERRYYKKKYNMAWSQGKITTSSLMLRMIAFSHEANVIPIMEQNRAYRVLRKDSSKEQTIDQFIVPVYQKTLILTQR